MQFPQPLARGRLLRRYKRFLADIEPEDGGPAFTAHVANPGAMLGLNAPGLMVWTSCSPNLKRKLPCTLELVEADGALVGVNTLNPNRIVAEALRDGRVPELAGYAGVRPEVKYGEASRVDFLLTSEDRAPCWLEVKNCHFRRVEGLAEFPDCVAARSARHLDELAARVMAGDRAVLLFVIQREDCHAFAAAADIDPKFAAALERAADAGVEVLPYACAVSPAGVTLERRIDWSRG